MERKTLVRIFRYLKREKLTVFLILILLVIQAMCDLSLPSYTSDIVDVGIQQSGIERAVPEQLRRETLRALELFMTEEEIQIVEQAYTETDTSDDTFVLIEASKEQLDRVEECFTVPMALVSQLQSQPEMSVDALEAALAAGMMTKDDLLAMRREMDGVSEMLISQMAVAFVKAEYESLGLDLGKMQTDYLWSTGAKMLGLTVLMMTVAIAAGLLASRTAARVGRDLRSSVFKKVISFSNVEMDRFSTASLITRSTNDIQQVQQVVVMLLRMVMYAPILGIGGVIKVAGTKTGMEWIIAVAVGVIILVVILLMVIAIPKFKKMQTLVDRLNLVSREILTGIPVIRAFSREKHEEERFDVANRDLMRTQLFTNRVMTFMMPVMMLVMNTITIMIVWFGAKGVDLGNMQVGDMMAFITYTMQIVMSFMMLTMISIMLPRANVAAARIDEVLSAEPVIRDPENNQDESLVSPKGVVSYEDVSFAYPGAGENVLEHITFTAVPGQTTAVIGSTGSGKSTLVHLLPRLYDVSAGAVKIDGVDIRSLTLHKLHSLLGFVPQKGILFSVDIASNLKFGGDDITDEAMTEAAEIAQAAPFIAEKPEGYHSPIAQGGTNVSGGQKQRLSIARAIAKHPKIYVFDDSFSALDYKTDTELRRALAAKTKDATVIIVAQRISTILHADQIIVLDDGRIVGMGRHEELMQNCETYREIARSQLSEKELSMRGGEEV